MLLKKDSMTNPHNQSHSIYISIHKEIKERNKEIEIDREERENYEIK